MNSNYEKKKRGEQTVNFFYVPLVENKKGQQILQESFLPSLSPCNWVSKWVTLCCKWAEVDEDLAVLDEERLMSLSWLLTFLKVLVGAAFLPIHYTLLECSGPNTLPTTSLSDTSDSLTFGCVIFN